MSAWSTWLRGVTTGVCALSKVVPSFANYFVLIRLVFQQSKDRLWLMHCGEESGLIFVTGIDIPARVQRIGITQRRPEEREYLEYWRKFKLFRLPWLDRRARLWNTFREATTRHSGEQVVKAEDSIEEGRENKCTGKLETPKVQSVQSKCTSVSVFPVSGRQNEKQVTLLYPWLVDR